MTAKRPTIPQDEKKHPKDTDQAKPDESEHSNRHTEREEREEKEERDRRLERDDG